ncbi:MAG TPA: DNA/RNA non-specific endonuclease [Burkholderiaceae bacterium]
MRKLALWSVLLVLSAAQIWVACGTYPLQITRMVTLQRGQFALDYDCQAATALRYRYSLAQDRGTLGRPAQFALDPALPPACRGQRSARSYVGVHAGYDRGHLVTSNHMDYDAYSMTAANYMSNIVPQVSRFNQGIWVRAENVAECYRDLAPLDVYGGVVYGLDAHGLANDYFLASHGIRTPEYFWKVIVTSDPASGAMRAIAWYIPNIEDLAPLDAYLLSVRELELLLGPSAAGIAIPDDVKLQKPDKTWPLPAGCQLSIRADDG